MEAMLFGDGLLVEAHSVDFRWVPARATSMILRFFQARKNNPLVVV
jgi:hypothetical protein